MTWLEEFKAFIRRGNVIDLAVAVIVGGAFNKIVASLVGDVITPVLGVATKQGDIFSGLDIPLYGDAVIKLGAFLQSIISFLIIAFVVFLLVKGLNAMHVQRLLEGEPKPADLSTQEKLLTEIRDLLRAQMEGRSKVEPPPPPPGTILTGKSAE
jgi:large conductance mechanosensitive channel